MPDKTSISLQWRHSAAFVMTISKIFIVIGLHSTSLTFIFLATGVLIW